MCKITSDILYFGLKPLVVRFNNLKERCRSFKYGFCIIPRVRGVDQFKRDQLFCDRPSTVTGKVMWSKPCVCTYNEQGSQEKRVCVKLECMMVVYVENIPKQAYADSYTQSSFLTFSCHCSSMAVSLSLWLSLCLYGCDSTTIFAMCLFIVN